MQAKSKSYGMRCSLVHMTPLGSVNVADHIAAIGTKASKGLLPIHYIHYAPYGELIANQQTIGYDERFKCGGDVNRGMPLSILGGKIGTARDVGNFAAGYLADRKGLSYGATMWAFDLYQNYQNKTTSGEPPVSRWAQTLGFRFGLDAHRANNFNRLNNYNAYR